MRKMLDLSRMSPFDCETEVLAVGNGTNKIVRGVVSDQTRVYFQLLGGKPILYDVFSAGRFEVHIRPMSECILSFKTDGEVFIEGVPKVTRITGDPEDSYTDLSPRPALNPEMAAMFGQMRLMQGELDRMKKVKASPPRPAPVVEPTPVSDPRPEDDDVQQVEKAVE